MTKGQYLSIGVSSHAVVLMSFAKYGRPVAKFGHDTGRRLLIVWGPTLKNYYTKTTRDRDLFFVALAF